MFMDVVTFITTPIVFILITMWKHPKAVGKNWFTHLLGALKIAIILQIGVIRCVIHAFIPDVDAECAQSTVERVQSRIV
jgi:hypothetical protein